MEEIVGTRVGAEWANPGIDERQHSVDLRNVIDDVGLYIFEIEAGLHELIEVIRLVGRVHDERLRMKAG
jgi:hypothetical protein